MVNVLGSSPKPILGELKSHISLLFSFRPQVRYRIRSFRRAPLREPVLHNLQRRAFTDWNEGKPRLGCALISHWFDTLTIEALGSNFDLIHCHQFFGEAEYPSLWL